MATVYVWKKSIKRNSVAHVSLYIHHTKDYISWLQTDSKCKLTLETNTVSFKEELPRTYDEDKDKFINRKAKYIYEIGKDCIDCNAVICRWESIIIEDGYHLFSKNCSTVVMEVLIAGAYCLRYLPKVLDVYTPDDVKKYAKQLHQLQRRPEMCFIKAKVVRNYHRRKYNCHCGGVFEWNESHKKGCTNSDICIFVLFVWFVCPFLILYDYLKDEMFGSCCDNFSRRNSDLHIV